MKRLSVVSVEIDELRGELTGLESEKRRLIAETREAQTPEYVEKQLREKLGLGREGEVIYVLPRAPESANELATSPKEEKLENWQMWARKFGF
jgi:cell division protein FtsB